MKVLEAYLRFKFSSGDLTIYKCLLPVCVPDASNFRVWNKERLIDQEGTNREGGRLNLKSILRK